ncbi:hypothetical protein Thimo_3571 [Thioflavicoccus mobilis 8321]|uniref:Microcin J25-processing protein McjB C-terminal domain-containing protein n=1 Tax=Thioflavicoccus mobilis 8321 TaxID=765912 RepID=L0H2F0_9GAMM|nr:lasso peptide biosynthesis B2 protein [Thioflavicoccus mobilis]AGA92227.1 hypothetical protein Thimo_3571 [Thioflavicoccus mobilis 8321]
MGRLAKFVARSSAERLLLLEAAGWLALSRLALLILPFRRIAPHLGQHMTEGTGTGAAAVSGEVLQGVSWAVAAAARHLPFEAVCLPQAMAAKAMLRRRGIQGTLYLGVARDEGMVAHAWLRVGDRVVTGAGDLKRYTVVSTFA